MKHLHFTAVLVVATALSAAAACRKTTPSSAEGRRALTGHREKGMSAALRLPAGCDVAGRMDLRTVLALEATQGHHHEAAKGAPDGGLAATGSAYFRLLTEAGIEPERDIDEVAICMRQEDSRAPDGGVVPPVRFMVIVSGMFEPGGVIAVVSKNAPPRMWQATTVSGVEGLRRENGKTLVQAADGTILFSDDEALLAAALAPQAPAAAYTFAEGHVALIAGRRALDSLTSQRQRGMPHPIGQFLGSTVRLELGIDLKTNNLRAQMFTPDVQSARQDELRIRETLKVLASGPGAARLGSLMPAGTLEAFGKATVASRGNAVLLEAALPPAVLGGLVHQTAILGTPGR